MDVYAGGYAGRALLRDDVSLVDDVPLRHQILAVVGVIGNVSIVMLDLDQQAIAAVYAGKDDHAAV